MNDHDGVRTIALFGATGRTGRRVLARALAAGFAVRALVRTPSKMPAGDPRLTVIEGDALDSDAVGATIAGADAVVTVVGHVKGSPPTLQTDATRIIVEQMVVHDVRRIVSLAGAGVRDPHDRPGRMDRLFTRLLAVLDGAVLTDARAHFDVLDASDRDWILVRAARLTERPGTGSYRVGWVGVGVGTQLSRDDLADFMLTQIDDDRFVHSLPFVSAPERV